MYVYADVDVDVSVAVAVPVPVSVYVSVYAYVYAYVYVYVYAYVYVCLYVCMYVGMCVYIYTQIDLHIWSPPPFKICTRLFHTIPQVASLHWSTTYRCGGRAHIYIYIHIHICLPIFYMHVCIYLRIHLLMWLSRYLCAIYLDIFRYTHFIYFIARIDNIFFVNQLVFKYMCMYACILCMYPFISLCTIYLVS